MQLAKPVSLLLGAVTCLPLCVATFHAVEPLWVAPGAPLRTLENPTPIELMSLGLLILLVAICIPLVYRVSGIDPQKRSTWVFFLVLFSLISVPLFWYWHLYREPMDEGRNL